MEIMNTYAGSWRSSFNIILGCVDALTTYNSDAYYGIQVRDA